MGQILTTWEADVGANCNNDTNTTCYQSYHEETMPEDYFFFIMGAAPTLPVTVILTG